MGGPAPPEPEPLAEALLQLQFEEGSPQMVGGVSTTGTTPTPSSLDLGALLGDPSLPPLDTINPSEVQRLLEPPEPPPDFVGSVPDLPPDFGAPPMLMSYPEAIARLVQSQPPGGTPELGLGAAQLGGGSDMGGLGGLGGLGAPGGGGGWGWGPPCGRGPRK